MTILGLSTGAFLLLCIPFGQIIALTVYVVRNKVEGDKEKEEYGVDDWYWTF